MMMFSLKSLFSLLFVINTTVYAQSIAISQPDQYVMTTAGQPATVELDFANQLTGVQHISVVIGFRECVYTNCPGIAPEDDMGTILFSGNYTPQYHEGDKPPYQNISVTIPKNANGGMNILNVAHFFLLGASSTPTLEFKNLTIYTQNSTTTRRSIGGRKIVD